MELRNVLAYIRQTVRPAAAQTDGELLARLVASGDNAAFETLLGRHGPLVLSVCRRLLAHREDAEDAFQATFLVLVSRAGAIARRESLGSWLYRVAYRTALKARSSVERRRRRELQVDDLPHPTAPCAEPGDWATVHEELSRLPEKYQAALVLCGLQGRSRQEAAALLGVPEGTLSSRLATARRLLGQRLSRRGVSLAVGVLAAPHLVPPALASSTTSLAALFAAGQFTAAGTSAASLAKGVMKAMLLAKVKFVMGTLLAVGLVSGGVVLRSLSPSVAAQPRPAAEKLVPQLEKVALRDIMLMKIHAAKQCPEGLTIKTKFKNGMIEFDVSMDAEAIAHAGELYKGRVGTHALLSIATSERPIASVTLHGTADGKTTRYHFRISPSEAKTSELQLGVYLYEKNGIPTVGGGVSMQVHLAGFVPNMAEKPKEK